jgi:hypothetical protein
MACTAIYTFASLKAGAASGMREVGGRRYRATISLGMLQSFASNKTIGDKFRALGFTEVANQAFSVRLPTSAAGARRRMQRTKRRASLHLVFLTFSSSFLPSSVSDRRSPRVIGFDSKSELLDVLI